MYFSKLHVLALEIGQGQLYALNFIVHIHVGLHVAQSRCMGIHSLPKKSENSCTHV